MPNAVPAQIDERQQDILCAVYRVLCNSFSDRGDSEVGYYKDGIRVGCCCEPDGSVCVWGDNPITGAGLEFYYKQSQPKRRWADEKLIEMDIGFMHSALRDGHSDGPYDRLFHPSKGKPTWAYLEAEWTAVQHKLAVAA